jgi:hypothetical protein
MERRTAMTSTDWLRIGLAAAVAVLVWWLLREEME